MTGHAILTPMLIVSIMLIGDLPGMSNTTDNVRPSRTRSVWRIRELTIAGVHGSLRISLLHRSPGYRIENTYPLR